MTSVQQETSPAPMLPGGAFSFKCVAENKKFGESFNQRIIPYRISSIAAASFKGMDGGRKIVYSEKSL
jgi:hypothetical protein